MNRTTFPLLALQQLREAQRDEHRRQLQAVRVSEAATQVAIEDLRLCLEQLRDRLRGATTPGVLEIDDLLQLKRQQQALRDQLRQRQRCCEELRVQTEQQHAALAAADREVRLLERLAQRYQQRATIRDRGH